jgi:hypothetical protein
MAFYMSHVLNIVKTVWWKKGYTSSGNSSMISSMKTYLFLGFIITLTPYMAEKIMCLQGQQEILDTVSL